MSWRRMQAIRGATTVAQDDPAAIRLATRELLQAMLDRNAIDLGELVSVLFTVTTDLTSEYPARAARDLGWNDVPLMCMTEIAVPGCLPHCIRVLMHVEFAAPRGRVEHVYLGAAQALRPDLGFRESASNPPPSSTPDPAAPG